MSLWPLWPEVSSPVKRGWDVLLVEQLQGCRTKSCAGRGRLWSLEAVLQHRVQQLRCSFLNPGPHPSLDQNSPWHSITRKTSLESPGSLVFGKEGLPES